MPSATAHAAPIASKRITPLNPFYFAEKYARIFCVRQDASRSLALRWRTLCRGALGSVFCISLSSSLFPFCPRLRHAGEFRRAFLLVEQQFFHCREQMESVIESLRQIRIELIMCDTDKLSQSF